jgi:membrane-bound lytic murein transglycosylase A
LTLLADQIKGNPRLNQIKPMNKIVLFILIVSSFSGCFQIVSEPVRSDQALVPLTYHLPDLSDDMDAESLLRSTKKSLDYFERIPADRKFRFGRDLITAEEMKLSLFRFSEIVRAHFGTDAFSKKIKEEFRIYRSVGSDRNGTVLYTGYYEPILQGSTSRTETYRYPLYRRPEDLLIVDLGRFRRELKGERIVARFQSDKLVPYHSRKEIDTHSILNGRGLELFWLSDPVDLFFLQIQGSGIILLEDGKKVHVGYDSSNGRAYRSIGRLLIDEGQIPKEEMSLQTLKRYLEENPGEIPRVLNHNESYVFFRAVKKGPLGSIGVQLTPGRSLATDRKLFPPGALVFIETEKPVFDETNRIVSWSRFSRFALNQDTGGAIRSPARADLFWGNGDRAELAAGHMQHRGYLYFLVGKQYGPTSQEFHNW